MKYRKLGQSGLKVSEVGLGTNIFGTRADRSTSIAIVHRALDGGLNLIDTANMYTGGSSEEIIGEALKDRRGEAILTTKASMKVGDGPNDVGSSRWHMMREVEKSLRRMKTDYIDLYLVHQFDPDTPLEETLRALDDLVSSGKVRYVGASNYSAWQLCKGLWTSDRRNLVRYEVVQEGYSLADRAVESEMVPMCLDQGVGLVAYFPLASGLLTGKYRSGQPLPEDSRAAANARVAERVQDPQRLELAAGLSSLAESIGCTPAQLALAWLLSKPVVTSVISGARTVAQLEENLGASDVAVPHDVVAQLDELSRPFIQRRFQ